MEGQEKYIKKESIQISEEQEVDTAGCPPIAAVGWIPHYNRLSEMPECEFTRHQMSKGRFGMISPFAALFQTGNPANELISNNPTPAQFKGREGLSHLVESRNFRGLIAIDKLSVGYAASKRPTGISFEWIAKVGYTRLPLAFGSLNVAVFQAGLGSSDFEVDVADDGKVTLRCWLRFKIGRVGDFGCWLLTGLRAPSAIIMVECAIQWGAQPDVTFLGTQIPTISAFVNWKLHRTHSMIDIGAPQIDGFLKSGGCKDAPVSELSTFGGEFELGPSQYAER